MILENNDIAFIAEMRTQKIQWRYLAKIYGMYENTLRRKWYRAMKEGMKCKTCTTS